MNTSHENSPLPYRGPGPLSSAWGQYKVNQLTATLVGTVVGVGLAAMGKNFSIGNIGTVASGFALGSIAGVPYGLYGAGKAWRDASAAKIEHEALVAENAELKQKLNWVERVAKGDEPTKDIGRG